MCFIFLLITQHASLALFVVFVVVKQLNSAINKIKLSRDTHLQASTQKTLQKICLKCHLKIKSNLKTSDKEQNIYLPFFNALNKNSLPCNTAVHVAQRDVTRRLLRLHVEFFKSCYFKFFVFFDRINTTKNNKKEKIVSVNICEYH